MMKKYMLCLGLLLLFFSLFALSVSAEEQTEQTVFTGTSGETITWSYDTQTAELTLSGTGEMLNYYFNARDSHWIEAKSIVVGEGITVVGTHAFRSCTALERVSLPSTVHTIGAAAFYGCSKLTSVTLPDSVRLLESEAFAYTGIQTIEISRSSKLEKISTRAFYSCRALEKIYLPKPLQSIETDAFGQCKQMKLVENASQYIELQKGSEAFGKVAFYAEELKKGSGCASSLSPSLGLLLPLLLSPVCFRKQKAEE